MRIMIVEDQTMLRDSLKQAINAQDDMEVVCAISDASQVPGKAKLTQPDIVLMDVCTEHDANGIAATRLLKEAGETPRVVIMTGMPEITFVEQARQAGADSFIYKNVNTGELLATLRSTMEGYAIWPADPRKHARSAGLDMLTDEEIAIMRLVCETKDRREIAAELYMSEGTVKRHISSILAKTGYDSILKLAIHYVSEGYIVPGLQ